MIIKTITDALSEIPVALFFEFAWDIQGNHSVILVFNTSNIIVFNTKNIVIDEHLGSYFLENNIKIADLTASLAKIQEHLKIISVDETNFFHDHLLFKDKLKTHYTISRKNSHLELTEQKIDEILQGDYSDLVLYCE